MPEKESVLLWLQKADPVSASAETNTLERVGLSNSDILVFLHSETKEGRFCSECLRFYYTPKVHRVDEEEIGRLGYGANQFTSGLKSLVDIVIRRVAKASASSASLLFCATGGFKAEIAFLNLMGALLEVEVVYIHELHRELVRLPRLPLTWDAQFVLQNEEFFSWIDSEPRKSHHVEQRLKANPQLRSLVEDGEDGFTYLSAAGDLLYRTAKEKLSMGPQVTWPSPDPKPPAEKNKVSVVEHHRPEGWERFVQRLCSIDCVSLVRYDETVKGDSPVRIINAEKGAIGIRYCKGDRELPLRVETTARGEAQTEYVADYVKRIR
jgi:putative CRISPR-associated protein (TIGR02619 family)